MEKCVAWERGLRSNMKIKAIIFDLDGVITNTEDNHYKAWKALTDRLGLSFDSVFNENLKGISRMKSLEMILDYNNVSDKFSEEEKEELCKQKNELYVQSIETLSPADILPGINTLIDDAKEQGIKLAVASVSKNARRVLEALQLYDRFDYVADAAKITRSKPHPDIFAVCAKELDVEPECCVGIEDSQAGIEAIYSAGMRSVGVGVTVVSRHPDLELASTEELSLEIIM